MPDPILIFGYGSLINAESRQRTLRLQPGQQDYCVRATVLPGFGHRRSWCFRSDTGFTALGVSPANGGGAISGVVHSTGSVGSLEEFDAREAGYRRVLIPPELLSFADAPEAERRGLRQAVDEGATSVYVYVPEPGSVRPASEDFPICQTYLDTVLEGCLEVGGPSMAEEFVVNTYDWSEFFLDDTPTSRRPWLHRKRYIEIDAVLEQYAERTFVKQRKHPEEFASQYLSTLRGLWGAPVRNPRFCGRLEELKALDRLTSSQNAQNQTTGISRVHVIGLGGVGKSQLVTEYVHRHYGSRYGLVVWLHSESEEDLIASLRRLAGDAGLGVTDKLDAEVIEEVKARLYRTRCSWLMVFDNVESPTVVDRYLPRGAAHGHVVVTARRMHPGWEATSLQLGCFEREDALAFLHCAAGESAGLSAPCDVNDTLPILGSTVRDRYSSVSPTQKFTTVGAQLAERLGHLPLALAVAASYMQRCDLDAAEYLEKLERTTHSAVHAAETTADYTLSFYDSIALSLTQIDRESALARQTLNALSFVAPDAISRSLVVAIVGTVMRFRSSPPGAPSREPSPSSAGECDDDMAGSSRLPVAAAASVGCGGLLLVLVVLRRRMSSRAAWMAQVLLLLGGCAAALTMGKGEDSWWSRLSTVLFAGTKRVVRKISSSCMKPRCSGSDAADEERAFLSSLGQAKLPAAANDAADDVWGILKCYSTIVVRNKIASIHRILQQVVQNSLTDQVSDAALCCCLVALQDAWKFRQWDPTTWIQAGNLVPHILVVVGHGEDRGLMPRTRAALLTRAGHYLSVALSRFDKADRLLKIALDTYSKAGCCQTVEYSTTLHHQGMVKRYLGEFAAAELTLREAHRILQCQLGRTLDRASAERTKLALAETLHEFGMVKLKQRQLHNAGELLKQSLEHKRALLASDNVDPLLPHRVRLDATLYQLGVIATVDRPPRLDDAEQLLRQVLEKQKGEGAAYAATLQQLGRVAVRRGNMGEATELLQSALKEFKRTYRSSLHVNIAAVHHRLGVVFLGLKQAKVASEHLTEALRIREYLYENGGHIDVAATLHELGRLSRTQNQIDTARDFFEREQTVLDNLLLAHEDDDTRFVEVLRKLTLSWRATRAIAKDIGAKKLAKSANCALKRFNELYRSRYPEEGKCEDCKPECCEDELSDSTNTMVAVCLEARRCVREELRAAAAASRDLECKILEDAGARVRDALGVYTKDDDLELGQDVLDSMRHFVSVLESSCTTTADIRSVLYECCDAIRATLRKNSVTVSD